MPNSGSHCGRSYLRARALNAGGKGAWHVGRALYRFGLALCGAAGALDAWADNAGYWDWRHG